MEYKKLQQFGVKCLPEFNTFIFFDKLSSFVNFDATKDLEEMEEWVNVNIQSIDRTIHSLHEGKVFYKPEKLRIALMFAYLVHFGQKRKDGEKYVVHLTESVENYLNLIKNHDLFCYHTNHKIDVTKPAIKLVLHDTLEDFWKNVHLELTPEEKSQFTQSMIQYITFSFGEEVALSTSLVFNKFSKRVLSEKFRRNFSDQDIGRFDFAAQLLNILEGSENLNDLRLILAEKEHNLESPQMMKPNKHVDFYNLQVSLLLASFRTYAKRLSSQIRYAYLEQSENVELKKVWEEFTQKVGIKKLQDKAYYEKYALLLQKDLEMLSGENPSAFTVEYLSLDDERVLEFIIEHYLKEKNLKRADFGDDIYENYQTLKTIIEDPLFEKILNKLFLGRVKIIFDDDDFEAFYEKYKRQSFHSFNIQQHSRKDHYEKNKKDNFLHLANYKALRLGVVPKQVPKDEQVKSIELKILKTKDHLQNEYGTMEFSLPFFVGNEVLVEENFTAEPLRPFFKHLEKEVGAKDYSLFKGIALDPLGCDIDNRVIKEAITKINIEIKKLRLFPLLATGGSTHS